MHGVVVVVVVVVVAVVVVVVVVVVVAVADGVVVVVVVVVAVADRCLFGEAQLKTRSPRTEECNRAKDRQPQNAATRCLFGEAQRKKKKGHNAASPPFRTKDIDSSDSMPLIALIALA